ncbi:MAG TPA: carbamoyltransferase HypF, partial [Spirochaetia bacterium]|nr:carbamoyltransferase HypF [Spirochaetia bacterium]
MKHRELSSSNRNMDRKSGGSPALLRRRYVIFGVIQGVGFRPTVFRCATLLGLTGFVQNRRSEVAVEVQGSPKKVKQFWGLLRQKLPVAARIESYRSITVDPIGEDGFHIIDSAPSEYVLPPIPPDLALCPDCRRELLDPGNRRHLYPFITCTQCGPRYSIVEDTPFDRENTSMRDFPQCPSCLREYRDPEDRRFHSQTNSCAACGPRLTLKDRDGRASSGDPVIETIRALKRGAVVAIQGIGGFHLAADPAHRETVRRLRSDKEREAKPFALMVRDLEEARRLCRMDGADERLLFSPESPILILPAREGIPEHLQGVSDTSTLGIMLPYTPLHLLLFFHPEVGIPYQHLIMTSGNLRGEPIITDTAEAVKKLGPVADLFLSHNRRILFRTDDSIQRRCRMGPSRVRPGPHRTRGDKPQDPHVWLLRRSRGFVPRPVTLSRKISHCSLALGGDLKSAPALALGSAIYLSPFIGDLENPETRDAFESQIARILSLYAAQPERLIFDLHPGYHSTRWALSREIEQKVQVQHHHAHLLSVMAEHDLEEVIGLSFDGTGYGTDGTIWGGEFLHATRSTFKRLGTFASFVLPGGEAAVLHPKRLALSLLYGRYPRDRMEKILGLPPHELRLLTEMIEKGVGCPSTTSLGRIFDAAAAVLGLVETVSYEGEGPIRLEGLALGEYSREGDDWDEGHLDALLPLLRGPAEDTPFAFDASVLVADLADRRTSGTIPHLALEFHRAVAFASLKGALLLREITGENHLALSGGVFQNMLLRELLIPRLETRGFAVHTNVSIPPG